MKVEKNFQRYESMVQVKSGILARTAQAVVGVVLLAHASPLLAGTDVGSGGDAVQCSHSNSNPLQGLYQVDYLMTLGPDDKPSVADVPAASWQASVERIRTLLLQKYPELGKRFGDYIADLNNFSDFQRPRIWSPTAHGLIRIDDQHFVRALPTNCGGGPNATSANILQAVVRIEKPRMIEYEADYEIMRSLEQAPLQYSFLLVHEWLWDLTDDIQAIRWANRLLHSESLERLSSDALRASLRNIGISILNPRFAPVCTRTEAVARRLEALIGLPCEKIKQADLEALDFTAIHSHRMELDSSGIAALQPADFSGLKTLTYLELGNNQITEVSGGLFAGANAIQYLELEGNQIQDVPGDLLWGLPSLIEVNLARNRITTIGSGFLSAIQSSQKSNFTLDLQQNQITKLPPDFLRFTGAKEFFIRLSNNLITHIPLSIFDALPAGSRGFILLDGNPIPAENQVQLKEAGILHHVDMTFTPPH